MDFGKFVDLARALDQADIVTVEGVPVRVAKPGALYEMKRDTARPIDHADAAALRQKFGVGND